MAQRQFRTILFSGILVGFTAAALASLYLAFCFYRATPYYGMTKSRLNWTDNLYVSDPVLGYAPRPDSTGAMINVVTPAVPVHHDRNGFRVPSHSLSTSEHPSILTLGCSYAYGYLVKAEETFSDRVAAALGLSSTNAAVSGYGLAQMLIQAKRLIPTLRPAYLLLEYAPWLVERGRSAFAPTLFGKIPTPYITDSPIATEVARPAFGSRLWSLPFGRFSETKRGVRDFISFQWHVGMPLILDQDAIVLSYFLKRAAHLIPPPALPERDEDTVRKAYEEIAATARANGTKVVIIALGEVTVPTFARRDWFPQDVLYVDAYSALHRFAKQRGLDYSRAFHHWRGQPPADVDAHPNSLAHQLIANEIVGAISAYRAGTKVAGR